VAPGDEIGEHDVAESLEVLPVPKEVGLADGDFGNERIEFRSSESGVAEKPKVRGAIADVQGYKTTGDAAGEVGVLIAIVGQAGGSDDVVLQKKELGIGDEGFRLASGHWGRGSHS
jgi:hypothetical protein